MKTDLMGFMYIHPGVSVTEPCEKMPDLGMSYLPKIRWGPQNTITPGPLSPLVGPGLERSCVSNIPPDSCRQVRESSNTHGIKQTRSAAINSKRYIKTTKQIERYNRIVGAPRAMFHYKVRNRNEDVGDLEGVMEGVRLFLTSVYASLLLSIPPPLPDNKLYSKDICSHWNVRAQVHVTKAQGWVEPQRKPGKVQMRDRRLVRVKTNMLGAGSGQQTPSWGVYRGTWVEQNFEYKPMSSKVNPDSGKAIEAGVLAVFHKVGQHLRELLLTHIHLDGFNGLEQLVPCKIVGKFCQELGPVDKVELQQCVLV
uniref:Uncharacterized protein n=1 Tax=Timema monikensis TaxID=170555 RepID=A0A7R9E947_9NEOP|nr:unnamed protein product [Timema monikensis]